MNCGADGKEFTVFDNSINYLNYSKIAIKSLLVSSPKCSNSFSMSDDIWFINELIRCFSSMAWATEGVQKKKRNKIWSLFVLRIKNLNREDRINTPGSLIVLQRKSMMTITESYLGRNSAVVWGRTGCPRQQSGWKVKESLVIASELGLWFFFFFYVWLHACMWGYTRMCAHVEASRQTWVSFLKLPPPLCLRLGLSLVWNVPQ